MTAGKPRPLLSRLDLPPLWLLAHLVLAWLVARAVPWPGPGPWMRAAGGLLAVVAVGLAVWAVWTLARHRTAIEPRHVPARLVTTGPFALSRNPIYLGMAMLLAGWGLWLGSVAALVTVPLFTAIITRRFILAEERTIAAHFPKDAHRHRARVGRWFGRGDDGPVAKG